MNLRVRSLAVVVLTLALLLTAAVPAWAQELSLALTPETVPADGQAQNYTLRVTGLELSTGYLNNQHIVVTYPEGFEFSVTDFVIVTVVVNNRPYVFSATAAKDTPDYVAKVSVPDATLPVGVATSVTIEDLSVRSPTTVTNSPGTVTVKFADESTVEAALAWEQAVESVEISVPVSLIAGQTLTVSGTVYDHGDQRITGKTVTVMVYNGETSFTQSATTGADGLFSTSFVLTTAGSYNVVASCDDVSSGPASVTVNAAAAKKLAFVQPPDALVRNVEAEFTVEVQDQYGNHVSSYGGDVYLTAQDSQGNLAGKFYSGDDVVSKVTLNSGSATFTFVPSVAGQVTITAIRTGLTAATVQYTVLTAPSQATLTLEPAVTDAQGNPVAGKAIRAVLTTDVVADTDYDLEITTLWDEGQDEWAHVPTPTSLEKGSNRVEFTITTEDGAKDHTLTVIVEFLSSEGIDVTAEAQVGPFVAPSADFTREFSSGWQVFSVPVKLDKPLVELLGGADKFEVLYLYDNSTQSWKQYAQMTDAEKYGKPLVGYAVKMKQAVLAQANYLPATSVAEAVPPILALKQGWNLVGASGDKLADVLASVKGKYSTVVNPGLGNRVSTDVGEGGWSAVTSESISEDGTTTQAEVGDAYWVFMTADGVLAGLMAQPLQ